MLSEKPEHCEIVRDICGVIPALSALQNKYIMFIYCVYISVLLFMFINRSPPLSEDMGYLVDDLLDRLQNIQS